MDAGLGRGKDLRFVQEELTKEQERVRTTEVKDQYLYVAWIGVQATKPQSESHKPRSRRLLAKPRNGFQPITLPPSSS